MRDSRRKRDDAGISGPLSVILHDRPILSLPAGLEAVGTEAVKALIQRVRGASVSVEERLVSEIGPGLLLLLGVEEGDRDRDAELLARKTIGLRIFEDSGGKMNLSILDAGGELLVVSQFTLAADCRKGRRPSFDRAAPPDEAMRLYEFFCNLCGERGLDVRRGEFAAHMCVSLINDGPVTIMLDSKELRAE